MKVCPQCQKVYTDETLNFCLDDGSVLIKQTSTSIDALETLVINQPNPTKFNQPLGTEQDWTKTPRYQPNSGGNSKTWLWVLGILVGLVLVCGGGATVLAIIGMWGDDGNQVVDNTPGNQNQPVNDTNSKSSEGLRKLVKSSDFSDWRFDSDSSIDADNNNGKLELTSRSSLYYVFVFKEFKTYNASTKVTVVNITGRPTDYGYGLMVNSHPTRVLSKDYVFLIDGKTGQYRIAKHLNKEESDIVKWTSTSAIKSGSMANDIEVQIFDKEMKLYINGQFIKTVEDTTDYKDGVAGIYTSDEVPITFTNLELRK